MCKTTQDNITLANKIMDLQQHKTKQEYETHSKSIDEMYDYMDSIVYESKDGPCTTTSRLVGETLVCSVCGQDGFFLEKEIDFHMYNGCK